MQECVGGAELQQQKSKIQSFSEQTSSALKRHVYANYMQFIETAKEISRRLLKIPMNTEHCFSVIGLFYRFGVGNVPIITFID